MAGVCRDVSVQTSHAHCSYGEHDPIVIQYGANTLPGKRYPIVSVTPEVCDHCRRKR
jgi:ribosomal protein S12